MDRRVIEKLLRTRTYKHTYRRTLSPGTVLIGGQFGGSRCAEKVVAIDLSRGDEGMIHHLIEGVVGTIPTRVSV